MIVSSIYIITCETSYFPHTAFNKREGYRYLNTGITHTSSTSKLDSCVILTIAIYGTAHDIILSVWSRCFDCTAR